MIRLDHVTVTYHQAAQPTLVDIDLQIPEGELCLVTGVSGAGKSTLLRAVNGLVPRFTGGTLRGRVTVAGRCTADVAPRDLADVVGYVGQDPGAGFVTDTVEDELAYVCENLGVASDVMRRRVEDVLDLLGLHELRQRPLRTLSGGQRQRVAIGSVLTSGARVLVLDEPTSALDPAAAEDVLAGLARLVHDLGCTVLVAEHRLERVVEFADRMVWLSGDGTARSGSPREVLAVADAAPPVVRLGRLMGWSPLPLSVREARRSAGTLRDRLASTTPMGDDGRVEASGDGAASGEIVAEVVDVGVAYGPVTALREVDVSLRAGEVVALMGRNGAGKSTLLTLLTGLRPAQRGTVRVAGVDPAGLPADRARRLVGFVPQDPALLLWRQRVDDELDAADAETGAAVGSARALLERIVPGLDGEQHPRDLSEGQRLALALAVVLVAEPTLVVLDEPTRGLDEQAKSALARALRELARAGRSVVVATHDVEVVAGVADRVVVLAGGEVVADGPARDVVCQSPVFAPQVAKVLQPQPWLTVAEVARAVRA